MATAGTRFASLMVRIGGVDRPGLRAMLSAHGVALNAAAETLFANERFTTGIAVTSLATVQLAVADLGLPHGAGMALILERAAAQGLLPCPLELGPHLRLQWLDQSESVESEASARHRAPPGSVTDASTPLDDDERVPKGFYLRKVDGVAWLRGYVSGPAHRWSPEDRLVFCRTSAAPPTSAESGC